MKYGCWVIFYLLLGKGGIAGPLSPVKTESPRDTFRTFLSAMNAYRKGTESGDTDLKSEISRATRTLDLSQVPPLIQSEYGKEAAIYLKEVVDRIIVVDLKLIPPEGDNLPKKWRLKDTDIVIQRMDDGDRKGEYLFSAQTVARAKDFYRQVDHLPYLKGSGGGAGYKTPWMEKNLHSSLKVEVLGYFAWQWLSLLVAIFAGLLVKKLAIWLMKLFQKLSKISKTEWDDKILEAIEKPFGIVCVSTFWFLIVRLIKFDGLLLQVLSFFIQVSFSIGIIWIFYRVADLLSHHLGKLMRVNQFILDQELFTLLKKSLRLAVLVIGILIAVQNLGINILSLVAGLGLGGLAFALAAKDTAANLFGSLMIFSDRPFRVGDWIQFDKVEGTVEGIGFRSTRVRTFYNSLISIPNGTVANASIDNLGRRQFRRVKTVLQVTYDTPAEKLEAFLEGIKNIIKANDYTRKDYFHVVFENFADSGLDILVYFFLRVENWSEELVERQNILVEILRLAKRMEVDFAFPTRTLHMESFPGRPLAAKHEKWDATRLKDVAKDAGPDGRDAKPSGLGIFVPPFREN